MTRLDFTVPGIPATKGSARAFVVAGKARITNSCERAKPWASAITLAAQEAMHDRPLLTGPVVVRLEFRFPWRKCDRRKDGSIRESASRFVSVKPDVDKTSRCALDALIGVAFRDDAQICDLLATKRYGDPPGVRIVVEEVCP